MQPEFVRHSEHGFERSASYAAQQSAVVHAGTVLPDDTDDDDDASIEVVFAVSAIDVALTVALLVVGNTVLLDTMPLVVTGALVVELVELVIRVAVIELVAFVAAVIELVALVVAVNELVEFVLVVKLVEPVETVETVELVDTTVLPLVLLVMLVLLVLPLVVTSATRLQQTSLGVPLRMTTDASSALRESLSAPSRKLAPLQVDVPCGASSDVLIGDAQSSLLFVAVAIDVLNLK